MKWVTGTLVIFDLVFAFTTGSHLWAAISGTCGGFLAALMLIEWLLVDPMSEAMGAAQELIQDQHETIMALHRTVRGEADV